MDIEGLEVKITGKRNKSITYLKNGVMVGRKCTECGEDKEIERFSFHNKRKGTYKPSCKECDSKKRKEYYRENKESENEKMKEYYRKNKERKVEYDKDYQKKNKEKISKQKKEYREVNKEKINEINKKYRKKRKERNLDEISKLAKEIDPIFEKLKLPIYGYIYRFTNIKTKHYYVGQTIKPLKERYKVNIIQGWIEHRKSFKNQKFLDELIEEDFIVEIIKVGYCEYHLNILEAFYINKYDSYNNGYNNNAGNHITDDGIEEFIEILQQHNLEFVDGQILKKAN